MKKLFVLITLLIIVFNIYAAKLEIDNKGFSFSSDNLIFSSDYGRLSMSYKNIEYGDVGRKGILRTIENVHTYDEFALSASSFRQDRSINGLVLRADRLSLMYMPAPYSGVGLEVNNDNLSLIYLYLDKREEGIKPLEKVYNAIDRSVMYFGARYRHRYFTIAGISSFDSNVNYLGFLSFKAEYYPFMIDLRIGNVFPLRTRHEYDIFSTSLGIKSSYFDVDLKVNIGNKPIYSYEYRSVETDKSVKIKLDTMRASFETKAKFTRNGVLKTSYLFSVENKYFNMHYNRNGFSYRVFIKETELSLRRGIYEIKIPFYISRDNWNMYITIGNKVGLRVDATIYI